MRIGIGIGFGGATGLPTPTLRNTFEAANLTKDGSNNISSLSELGSVGGALTEGITARQPLWVNAANPNGALPIMRQTPDGTNIKRITNAAVASDAFTSASGFTILIVTRVTLSGGSSTDPVWYYNNGAVRGGWLLEIQSSTRTCQARTSAGVVKSATFGAYTTNTWEMWTLRNWGGGSNDVDSAAWFKARVNGNSVAVGGTPWFWVPTTRIEAFGGSSAVAGPVREVAECVCYPSYLSDSQCAQAEAILNARHGVF